RNERSICHYPPINTVTSPGGMTMPPEALGSVIRAAGVPPIMTVAEPFTMASTPQLSPIRAAGSLPIRTVGAPGGMIGVGTPCVAVLVIRSVTRAAGGMLSPPGIGESIDLHHATLDHRCGTALYRRTRSGHFRAGRSGRFESALRLQIHIRSFDLDVFGGF